MILLRKKCLCCQFFSLLVLSCGVILWPSNERKDFVTDRLPFSSKKNLFLTFSPSTPSTREPSKTAKFQFMLDKISAVHIPKVYQKDFIALQKYLLYLNQTEKLLPLQTRAVIILTNYRSGSSFFGELFNQHPDVFYAFEPLIMLGSWSKCFDNVDYKKDVLQSLSQCIIPDWNKIYNELIPKPSPGQMNMWTLHSCTKKRFCFAPFTKELLNEKHCTRSKLQKYEIIAQGATKHNPWKDCGSVNVNLAANECRRKKWVAIKVIRACDVNDFEEIVKQFNIDLRVIQLLRDPRGIASSRLRLHKRLSLIDSSHFTCNRQLSNLRSGILDPPDWLKGKYKVFRFEDIALDPIETAHEVYQFLGLHFPNSVKEWIHSNTKLDSLDDATMEEVTNSSSRLEQTLKRKKSASASDPWSRTRNSKSVIYQWQQQLLYSQVNEIEEQCVELMKLAGYLPVGDPSAYKDKNNLYLTNFDL